MKDILNFVLCTQSKKQIDALCASSSDISVGAGIYGSEPIDWSPFGEKISDTISRIAIQNFLDAHNDSHVLTPLPPESEFFQAFEGQKLIVVDVLLFFDPAYEILFKYVSQSVAHRASVCLIIPDGLKGLSDIVRPIIEQGWTDFTNLYRNGHPHRVCRASDDFENFVSQTCIGVKHRPNQMNIDQLARLAKAEQPLSTPPSLGRSR